MDKFFILLLLTIYSFQVIISNDIDVSKFRIASLVNQIILVIPPNYTTTEAMLYFYVKNGNKWVERMETEAIVGRNGFGKTKEGDGKTPVGMYQFDCYFGINDNPGTDLPYIQVNESHYWDGDSKSKNYNTLVNNETYSNFNHSESEHIIDYNPGYEYVLNIDYNKEQTPNKGSAIFLHCFTGRNYTGGCISIDKYDLHSIYTEINGDCYIIIDTEENMTKYYFNKNNSSKYLSFRILLLFLILLF